MSQLAGILGAVMLCSQPCDAWTVASRELVDLQFTDEKTLTILLSAPGTAAPGIYRWRDATPTTAATTATPQPELLCALGGPITFSFDRKLVIERASGEASGDASALNLYRTTDCKPVAHLLLDGRIVDADARGGLIAVALRLPGDAVELRLYDRAARQLASTPLGRNVEIGFAADGRSLINFDPSDAGVRAWRLPSLTAATLPAWTQPGGIAADISFVPGSAIVQMHESARVSLRRWPDGAARYSIPAGKSTRLRQLSAGARFGLAHQRQGGASNGRPSEAESLTWTDFATGLAVPLATGSIDHAAISASGSAVAWVEREPGGGDAVTLRRTTIAAAPASGAARATGVAAHD